jgi:hypothetical protein
MWLQLQQVYLERPLAGYSCSMHACRLPFCLHWIKVGLA